MDIFTDELADFMPEFLINIIRYFGDRKGAYLYFFEAAPFTSLLIGLSFLATLAFILSIPARLSHKQQGQTVEILSKDLESIES